MTMHTLSHQVKDAGAIRLVRAFALEARTVARRGAEGCTGVEVVQRYSFACCGAYLGSDQ